MRLSLESVARQSREDFECIVVDDASTDGTGAIAEAFAARDPRFRVIRKGRSGLVAALNEGLAAARAPWIARMDADDWMVRRRLEYQLTGLAADSGLAGVGSHVRVFPRAGLRDGRRNYEAWLNSMRGPEDVRRERFVECPLAHPTWFIERRLLVEFGYRDHDAPEDYDLLLRLLGAGHRLGVVPRRLLHWRDSEARLSRVDARYSQSRFTWLKALHLSRSFLLGHARYVLWGYGGTGKALAEQLASRGHVPSHIVEVHPGRIGQTIRGAPVIDPASLGGLHVERMIVSVAGERARGQIRDELTRMGRQEGTDYVCAA